MTKKQLKILSYGARTRRNCFLCAAAPNKFPEITRTPAFYGIRRKIKRKAAQSARGPFGRRRTSRGASVKTTFRLAPRRIKKTTNPQSVRRHGASVWPIAPKRAFRRKKPTKGSALARCAASSNFFATDQLAAFVFDACRFFANRARRKKIAKSPMKAADIASVWIRSKRRAQKKRSRNGFFFLRIHCFGPSGVSGRFC